MRLGKTIFRAATLLTLVSGLIVIIFLFFNHGTAFAARPATAPTPQGPNRFTTMQVDYTRYVWWLAAWSDNKVYCSFYADHEGLPTENDVYSACKLEVYNAWKANSKPCEETDSKACPGYYFIQIAHRPATREVTVKLPSPQVWISLTGCNPDKRGWCTQQPKLVLTAEEPLPNESIVSIEGTIGKSPFKCEGKTCTFKLSKTIPAGIRIKFWANSTFGDNSKPYDALLRVLDESSKPGQLSNSWYVDVISSQWTGTPTASCAAIWEAFPPTEGLPQWLVTPASIEDLKSNIPYNYLAANLISQGVTDATNCPNGGLNSDGSANGCGIRAAQNDVREWQNRFDQLIFTVAQDVDVPAQLLKNLFSRESQFWPGVFKNGKDIGLGQMTEGGADTTLLWNPSFYNQFCPLILNKNQCETKGFASLKPYQQDLLRGALVGSVDARCANCPLGLDLSRANFSIKIFAHTLLANCEQAGKIVQNVSGHMPGEVVDYETMWRFTLVNYNAGAGCLSEAITQTYDPGAKNSLKWENVSPILESDCPGSTVYVEDISKDSAASGSQPTETPTATP